VDPLHNFLSISQRKAKLEILSHSKWNKNMWNNFVCEYWSLEDKNIHIPSKCYNSEIIWSIDRSKCLNIKFYYPNHNQTVNNPILYSIFEFNFTEIYNKSYKNVNY
jgi:NRPS condensation-like uncharacterized protein